MLLAFSVNQDIGFSSTATMTIVLGVINQGEESTHPCAPTLPIPSQALHTCSSGGPARVQLAVVQLPSLALCHNNNPEGVVLEGDGAPQGRGGQKNVGAAGLWDCNTAFLHKNHTAQRSNHGARRGGRKNGACAWQFNHKLHNKDPSYRF